MSRALERNFISSPASAIEAQIEEHIAAYHAQALRRDEAEMFAQKKRLAEAERKLAIKVTKTAEKERGIAQRKIETLKARIARRQSDTAHDSDARIFPMYYAPLLVDDGGERVIRPYRYHLRPNGQPEAFDSKYPGCYNARFDNLRSFVWRNAYGKNHAILVARRFYENVARHTLERRALAPGEREEKVVLQFEPTGFDCMLIPCIYDEWRGRAGTPMIRSFAAITFEPPPEVAATGHDRCPGFLKARHIDAWLQPQARSREELGHILADRETPHYAHARAA